MSELPRTPLPTNGRDIGGTPADKADWLLRKIGESIVYIQAKRLNLKRWASRTRLLSMIVAGGITVALGIRWEPYEDFLRNLAFLLGAMATTLASIDLYFNYRDLWIEHEEAKWRLHRLKDRIEFYLAGTAKESVEGSVISEFHDSYQWIWDHLSTNWLALRRSNQAPPVPTIS